MEEGWVDRGMGGWKLHEVSARSPTHVMYTASLIIDHINQHHSRHPSAILRPCVIRMEVPT